MQSELQDAEPPMRIRRTASDIEREQMADAYWGEILGTEASSNHHSAAAAESLRLELEMSDVEENDEGMQNHGGEEYALSSASNSPKMQSLSLNISRSSSPSQYELPRADTPSIDQHPDYTLSRPIEDEEVPEINMPERTPSSSSTVAAASVSSTAVESADSVGSVAAPNTDIASLSRQFRMPYEVTPYKRAAAKHILLAGLKNPVPFMQPTTYSRTATFAHRGRRGLKHLVWQIKFDGNRVRWDGFQQHFISRGGNLIMPPQPWLDCLPLNCILDGELFCPAPNAVPGTATEFASDLSYVSALWTKNRDSITAAYWKPLVFVAFDIINSTLIRKSLIERRYYLLWLYYFNSARNGSFFKVAFTGILKGTTALEYHASIKQLRDHYAALGAEGIVVKDGDSEYAVVQQDSNAAWIKVKVFKDTEALVLGVLPRRAGQALPPVNVQLPSGETQFVTFSNGNLIRELRRGTIVRIDYMPVANQAASGKVRTPIIRGLYADGRSWEQIQARDAEKRKNTIELH